jgi:hypothetical protein
LVQALDLEAQVSIYQYWATVAGVDPDPRPVYWCRNLEECVLLPDLVVAIKGVYVPALRAQIMASNPLIAHLPKRRLSLRRRCWLRIPKVRLNWEWYR